MLVFGQITRPGDDGPGVAPAAVASDECVVTAVLGDLFVGPDGAYRVAAVREASISRGVMRLNKEGHTRITR